MIVLEGPDGGGKTTLLETLTKRYPQIPVAPRASSSVEGPVKNLFEWATQDVSIWPLRPYSIYDRHPLISEYVYGNSVRKKPGEGFTTQKAATLRQLVYRQALVIFCLPPLKVVRENVQANAPEQMAGVVENITKIYQMYAFLARTWPGRAYIYNYTDKLSLPRILSEIELELMGEPE